MVNTFISQSKDRVAPGVGFEPTTNRLTADRSTTELPRNRECEGAQNRGDVLHGKIFLQRSALYTVKYNG